MKVIFLDFDGVVNIPYWKYNEYGNLQSNYNFPSDGRVNNYQAVQWVCEFCEKYDYKIVISSTWRKNRSLENCTNYLTRCGLRQSVKVIGMTPVLSGKHRGDEITLWLNQHPEVTDYLIFDDDSDMTIHTDKLIKCDSIVGFTLREYEQAEILHFAFNNN
jgi:hypothetical protein